MAFTISGKLVAVVTNPIVKTSASETHVSTDWEFSDSSDFSNIVESFYDDTDNLETRVYSGLLYSNLDETEAGIYFRTRFKSQNFISNWSNAGYIALPASNSPSLSIETPTILSISDIINTKNIKYYSTTTSTSSTTYGGTTTYTSSTTATANGYYIEEMTVVASPFNSTPNAVHTETVWFIESLTGPYQSFSFTTVDPMLTTINLKGALPGYPDGLPLRFTTQYRITVKYKSDDVESDEYETTFTTKNCTLVRPNAGPSGTNTYIPTGTCLSTPTPTTTSETTSSSTSSSPSSGF